jgi:hypothetical protein
VVVILVVIILGGLAGGKGVGGVTWFHVITYPVAKLQIPIVSIASAQ